MRREYLLLTAVTAIGFALRIISINKWPLWSDEAMTLLIVQWPYTKLFLAPVDPTPGLYYSVHKLLLGPDVGVVAARSISLVCGALTIPAAYFFAKSARIPALLTASFVALSFPLIDYSQEGRAYAMLVLFIVCSAWAFVSRRWLLFALTLVLALYTHFVSVFWIGPAATVALWKDRKAFAPLGLAAILAVPELGRILAFPPDGWTWLHQAGPLEALRIWALSILPALLCLPLIRRVTFQNELTPYAISILTAAPLAIWLFGFAKQPVFMERTILLSIPGYLAFLALAVRPRLRVVAVAIFAACLAFTGTMRAREDWHSARWAGTPILCYPYQAAAFRHATGWNGPVILRYDNREVVIEGTLHDYFAVLSTANFKREVNTNGAPCLDVIDQSRPRSPKA